MDSADLPVVVRLLCLSLREPRWTALSVHLSRSALGAARLVWLSDVKSALTALREAACDAVIVGELNGGWTASAAALLEFVTAAQALDAAVPIVALVPVPDDRLLAELSRRDCELCVTPRLWDSPAVPAAVARALRRRQQVHELQRYAAAHHRRLAREQADVQTILRLQHDLLRSLPTSADTSNPAASLTWADRYSDLLKAAILSDPQRLSAALAEFVECLALHDVEPRNVLALHVDCVQSLSAELGGRLSPQMLSRADLLALELLAALGERYRQQTSPNRPSEMSPEVRGQRSEVGELQNGLSLTSDF
jgi:hypothetical protein